MKLYFANLAAYNNGILKGAWFDLEDYTDVESLMDDVQANVLGDDEEWAIHDYEAPFTISENPDLDEISAFIAFGNLDEQDQKKAAYLYDNGNYNSAIDCIEHVDDVEFYEGMTLKDVAEELVEEGCFGTIPETIKNYIDYEAIARDLDYDGYHETSEGVFCTR